MTDHWEMSGGNDLHVRTPSVLAQPRLQRIFRRGVGVARKGAPKRAGIAAFTDGVLDDAPVDLTRSGYRHMLEAAAL